MDSIVKSTMKTRLLALARGTEGPEGGHLSPTYRRFWFLGRENGGDRREDWQYELVDEVGRCGGSWNYPI